MAISEVQMNSYGQYLHNLLSDVGLQGKSILDIGCGDGWVSLYMARNGAKWVVGLEPMGAGSLRIPALMDSQLRNVMILCRTIQDYDTDILFDLIILHDSVNHLNEDACICLRDSKIAMDVYLSIFRKLYGMLNQGGKVVIADASRRNLFADLGLRNPFDRSIEWHKHQTPELWAGLLGECGFRNAKISWLTPRKLLMFDWLLGNKWASYCLVSHFRLVMEKV